MWVSQLNQCLKLILIKSTLPALELSGGECMAFQQCHTKSVNRNINKVMKRWILFRTKYSEDLESTVRKIFLVIDILFFLSHLYQAVVSFIGICNGYKQGLCFISSFSFCSVSHSLNVLFISVPHAFSSSALRKLTCPPLKKSS